MVEDLAVGFIATLLVRFSTSAVADAYCARRLGPDRGLAYGTNARRSRYARHHRSCASRMSDG